jgi:putative transposase
VTARGVDRAALFRDDEDRILFLRLLGDIVQRFGWRCHALCLMGTHYHLVLETVRARLSEGLHRLNGTYAQSFNHRHKRSGHVFGHHFHAWVVEDEDHLRNTCRYVLLNPLRAGLCDTPADWPWSWCREEDRAGRIAARKRR